MAFFLLYIDNDSSKPQPLTTMRPCSISPLCEHKISRRETFFFEEYVYATDNTRYLATLDKNSLEIFQGLCTSSDHINSSPNDKCTISVNDLAYGSFISLHFNIISGVISLCKSLEQSIPLFFTFTENGTMISNHMPLIKSRLPNTSPNEEMIFNSFIVNPVHDRNTFYSGIYKVMNGEHIETCRQRIISSEAFCIRSAIDKKNRTDISTLKDLLTRNISLRTSSHKAIGSHMSGGFDSSIVSAIAARIAKPQGKSLYTFSSLQPSDCTEPSLENYSNDEYPYISDMIKEYNNIKPILIYDDQCTLNPTTYTRYCFEHSDGPESHPTNIPWRYEIFHNASTKNVGVLLNAQFGNNTISRSTRSFFKTLQYYRRMLFDRGKGLDAFSLFLKNKDSLKESNLFRFGPQSLLNNIRSALYWRNFQRGLSSSLPLVYNIDSYDPTGSFDLISTSIRLNDKLYRNQNNSRTIGRELGKQLIPERICNRTTCGAQYTGWALDFFTSIPHFKDVFMSINDDPFLSKVLDLKNLRHYIKPETINQCTNQYGVFYSTYRMNLMRILHISEWYLLAKYA